MLLLLPRQFYPIENLNRFENRVIAFIEAAEFYSSMKFHKQKVALEMIAVRNYFDLLMKKGFQTEFQSSIEKNNRSFEDALSRLIETHAPPKITVFEIEDLQLEERIKRICKLSKIGLEVKASPAFMTKRKDFETYLKAVESAKGRPMMRTFYTERRRKLRILVDSKGEPAGGQFSYENLNSLRLAREIRPPKPPVFEASPHFKDVAARIQRDFKDHPGTLEGFSWPTSRDEALRCLDDFLKQRLARFTEYEDSFSSHSDFLFHSALSSSLNLGLLTSLEVIHQTLESAKQNDVPLQSLEGFLRQILGWREFIRGIYLNFGDELPDANFWNHSRKLRACWFDGSTGLPFLDEAIKKALRLGYNHPIERLMILSNMMLLCEVHPQEAYRWFMEMQIDSAEWVTLPNVVGLGQYADGGLVSTRPYICGSAYIRKMGHYGEGPWCDIVDGLYWSFVEKHTQVFAQNPRISVALPALRKLDPNRKQKIFADAAKFKERVTLP